MIQIPKWPAVILTSYRTGSTPLGFELVNQNPGTVFFNEPAYHGGIEMEQFTQAFDTNNYLVKVMADTIVEPSWPVPQHPVYQIEQMLSYRFYKIKLCRKDEIKQIASYYLARIREQWGYYGSEAAKSEYLAPVELDLFLLRRSIAIIKYNNKVVRELPSDITLYYEDITEFEEASKITPKPSNYDILIKTIKNLSND